MYHPETMRALAHEHGLELDVEIRLSSASRARRRDRRRIDATGIRSFMARAARGVATALFAAAALLEGGCDDTASTDCV
jgi:hypothetical protein